MSFCAFFFLSNGTPIGVRVNFDSDGNFQGAAGAGFKLTGHKLTDFIHEGEGYDEILKNFKDAGAHIQLEK